MNKQTLDKMLNSKAEQENRIKSLENFHKVNHEVKLEYKLANDLQQARKDAALSQKDLAEIMGTSQSVISRIEKGYNVSIHTIERYAQACGKTVELKLI